MKYNDKKLLIPQRITKWGILSSFLIFACSFVAYKYKYYLLTVLSFCLFVTSIIHWHKIRAYSLIRIVDFLFSILTIGVVTFYYIKDFKPEYKKLWYYTILIMLIAFVFNNIIKYYQIMYINKPNILFKCQEEYNYFSLEYTKPNTPARELCYYYIILIHIFFIHIIPTTLLMYCMINSH